MRTTILALAAILAVASAAVAADRVTIAPPLMKVVNNMQRLRDVCPDDGKFDACTRFVAFSLTASCSRQADRWSIDASATFKPWIFLWNLGSMQHEQLHISDIRSYTETYLELLMSESFESQGACEDAALAASQGFGLKMHEFATRSNELRHRATLRAAR